MRGNKKTFCKEVESRSEELSVWDALQTSSIPVGRSRCSVWQRDSAAAFFLTLCGFNFHTLLWQVFFFTLTSPVSVTCSYLSCTTNNWIFSWVQWAEKPVCGFSLIRRRRVNMWLVAVCVQLNRKLCLNATEKGAGLIWTDLGSSTKHFIQILFQQLAAVEEVNWRRDRRICLSSSSNKRHRSHYYRFIWRVYEQMSVPLR